MTVFAFEIDGDSIRPRGTVEVRCSKPDCGWSFWVDALDKRLPGGPFLCPGACDGVQLAPMLKADE